MSALSLSNQFSREQVSSHNRNDDLFLIIEDKVYDVTCFQWDHPGGADKLLGQAGADVTGLFEDAGHSQDARHKLQELYIGDLKAEDNAMGTDTNSQGEKEGHNQNASTSSARIRDLILATAVLAAMGLLSFVFFWINDYLLKQIGHIIRDTRSFPKLVNNNQSI